MTPKSRHYWKELGSSRLRLKDAIPLEELRELHHRDRKSVV